MIPVMRMAAISFTTSSGAPVNMSAKPDVVGAKRASTPGFCSDFGFL